MSTDPSTSGAPTIYVVTISDDWPAEAAHVASVLRRMGGVEFWRNVWFIELHHRPERWVPGIYALSSFYVAEFEPSTCFFHKGPGSKAARLFFSERLLPRLIGCLPPDAQSATVTYFAGGEADFAGMLNRYVTSTPEVTPLCRDMLKFGSDKGLGWHTYTHFYNTIFCVRAAHIKNVLEIGLGTNNIDVPSNMGPDGVPGASLRGWRAMFPSAAIYGADVDRRVLFEEDRIRTFYVDQLRPDTFPVLWSHLPDQVDVIIDDGLHTIEAAVRTMESCVDHLRPGGIYVVEDVPTDQISDYASAAASRGLRGFALQIPHPLNGYDNNLVVATK